MNPEDGVGSLFQRTPAREAVKRGWVCALLPRSLGGDGLEV